MLIITQTALELGFLYAPVALALFLSYRILDIADLTTDGCFVLGAAVSVSLTAAGHPFLAIPAAMLAGACAGLVTAFLQTNLGVPSILAGIVTNTGLYTVNLMAMGWKANQSLLGSDTVFTLLRDAGIGGAWYKLLLAVIVTGLAAVLLRLFLGTHLGLSLRATGDNPDMVRASSLNPAFTISVGLCLANAMTGLAGAMVGQYQKTVDINSGTGIVVIGLACLIIGETVLGRRSMTRGVLAALVGSLIYRFIYAVVFYTKIVPVECLKLLTAIIVALAIAAPSIQRWAAFQRRKAAAKGKGATDMLDIQHISKTFNVGTVNEKRAVTDLSLHLDKGDFVTVIGSNGAGKSTLFNAIAGSFYVDEGRILLNGKDITFTREHDRSRVIGRLFQDPLRGTAPHMSIEENLALAYLRAAHGNPFSRITAKDRELFRAQLAQLDMGLEDRLGQPVGLLSGGQRQALTLLMATMVPPELLLLDEHTAALDPGTAEKVLALTQRVVAEHHITCLMVTHNMTQALSLGNRTLMMADGGIVLDVAGAERAGMTVEDLVERFRAGTGRTLDNDRMLLSE